jgi:hypothetical protein
MAGVIDTDSHMFEQLGSWRDRLPANRKHLSFDLEEDAFGYTRLKHKGNRLLQCYISEPGKLWESYELPHQRQSEGQSAPRITSTLLSARRRTSVGTYDASRSTPSSRKK